VPGRSAASVQSSLAKVSGGDLVAGEPARGYSCPPFEPGNQAVLRHGYRPRVTEDDVAEVLAVPYEPELVTRYPAIASVGAVDRRVRRGRVRGPCVPPLSTARNSDFSKAKNSPGSTALQLTFFSGTCPHFDNR